MAITDSNGKPINGGRGTPPNPAQIAERAANARSSLDPAAAVEAFAGSENIKGLASGAAQRVEDFVQATGFGKALRSFGLLPDAQPDEFEFIQEQVAMLIQIGESNYPYLKTLQEDLC